jgi:hypothetical protein
MEQGEQQELIKPEATETEIQRTGTRNGILSLGGQLMSSEYKRETER